MSCSLTACRASVDETLTKTLWLFDDGGDDKVELNPAIFSILPCLNSDKAVTQKTSHSIEEIADMPKMGMNTSECGDPGGSRTPNPQIRSLMLYPVELRGRESIVNQRSERKSVLKAA